MTSIKHMIWKDPHDVVTYEQFHSARIILFYDLAKLPTTFLLEILTHPVSLATHYIIHYIVTHFSVPGIL